MRCNSDSHPNPYWTSILISKRFTTTLNDFMPSEQQSLRQIQVLQHPHYKPFENALPLPQNWIELPRKSPVFIVRSSGCKIQGRPDAGNRVRGDSVYKE